MIRHLTASAVVLDDHGRVLLVHHRKLDLWLYPGGHLDPDETPAEAAVREVREETGVDVEVITAGGFHHPATIGHPVPWAILEMPVQDRRVGPHHHIDLVYVCRATTAALARQEAEVSDCRWVPLGEVAALHTPPELPALVAEAAAWAKQASTRGMP